MTRDAPQVSGITEEMRKAQFDQVTGAIEWLTAQNPPHDEEDSFGAAQAEWGQRRLLALSCLTYLRDIVNTAALSAMPAQEWRPIETAPKDGAVFRAGYFIDDQFSQFDCFYGKKAHQCISDYCDSDWHDKRFGYQQDAFRCAMFEEQMKPTHWQPLPTPPTTAQEG